MPKTPTPSPEQPTVDELIAESRRLQSVLSDAAKDVDAWIRVLRANIAAAGEEEPDAQ